MFYGGIDEAGYGPMLGPLCVGGAVFSLSHETTERPCLWSMLDQAVTRAGRDPRRRIAIDDSKKLKGASNAKRHPLRHLERGVLCMLAMLDGDRSWLGDVHDIDVLDRLGVRMPDAPWFQGSAVPLPLGNDAGLLRLDAKGLQSAMDTAGVELHALTVRALDVPEYNTRVEGCGAKSRVNFECAASLMDRFWQSHPGLHLVMDRHGGRSDYLRDLRTSWPQAAIKTIRCDTASSDYRMEPSSGSDAALHLHVRAKADGAHLPVALASMAAKLVRELFMLRLNRFFSDLMPDLTPTAGYVEDGRRWLASVQGVLADQGLDSQALVRSR